MKTEVLRKCHDNCTDKHRIAVFSALNSQINQKLRVYRTYTQGCDIDQTVVFSTTNKDIHLFLGLFEKKDLWHFGQLLEYIFEAQNDNELLLYEENTHDRGTYITRSEQSLSAEILFTMSPAH